MTWLGASFILLLISLTGIQAQTLVDATRQEWTWKDYDKFVSILNSQLQEINSVDAEGKTPLHWAAHYSYQTSSTLLLIKGANPNAKDSQGYTPIMRAVNSRSDGVLRLLALKGADVNVVANDKMTALSLALKSNQFETAEFLLWMGAQLETPGIPPDLSPRVIAKASQKKELIELVEVYQSSDAPTFSGTNHSLPAFAKDDFQKAAKKGDLQLLEKMLQSKMPIDNKDSGGCTALHRAIQSAQTDIVFYLLMMGADPNLRRASNDTTPMMMTQGWHGESLDLMRLYLILKGASIHTVNTQGWSEVAIAARDGNLHGLRMIYYLGGDLKKDGGKGTPFQVAAKEGRQPTLDLLKKYGVNEPMPVSTNPVWNIVNATKRGDKVKVDEYLASGLSVDTAAENGDSLLMQAILSQQIELAKYFIQLGANINYANPKNGLTPLLTSMVWDYPDMTEFRKSLIEKGANVNARSKTGQTALMRCLWHHPTKPLMQLIEAGADLNIKDEKGRTALAIAIEDGKLKTAAYLREKGAKE